MAGPLNLRRRKDGSLHVTGDPPVDHYFSAGFIRNGLASGEVTVRVTLRTAGGEPDLVYELAGLEQEDGTKNLDSWHVTLMGGE